MRTEEVYLENDGRKIHCKMDYPENLDLSKEKCPLFILEHLPKELPLSEDKMLSGNYFCAAQFLPVEEVCTAIQEFLETL